VGTITRVDEFVCIIAFNAIIVLPAPVGRIMQPFLLFLFQRSSASF